MKQVVQAIYEQGVLKPLERLDLPEHQQVIITVQTSSAGNPSDELEAWHQVYAGLTDDEIKEIEAIVLDRSGFSKQDK